MQTKKYLLAWSIVLVASAALAQFSACYHILPTVVEEAADSESPSRKIVRRQAKRWISHPITGFEKNFDFNKNGRLEPDELTRLRMARGYYHGYGNVWKYDKDKNWRFDQEEYYDANSE